jgi:hypothetical protein
MSLKERIKAALDAPCGAIDFGGVGRELLTLVLAEIDRSDVAIAAITRMTQELDEAQSLRPSKTKFSPTLKPETVCRKSSGRQYAHP